MMRNLPRQWILWVATMAVLLGSLAPGISRILAGLRQQQVAWVEVCTAQGAQFIAVKSAVKSPVKSAMSFAAQDAAQPSPEEDQPSPRPMHDGEGHCPFCLLQAQGMAPPPAVSTLLIVAGVDGQPFLFLHAPQPLHAWSSAHARAPPVLA